MPTIVDQHGNIIDGFHRQKACDEIGTFCEQVARLANSSARIVGLVKAIHKRAGALTVRNATTLANLPDVQRNAILE